MRKAWVRKVDPVGLHGFKQGELTLDGLEPGLNLVVARNATGKSTLAKAIGLLFDPAKCERDHLILGVIDGRDGERHVQAKRKAERYPGFPGEYDQYQLDLLRLIEGFKSGQSPLDAEIADGMRFTAAPAVGMQRLSEVIDAKGARQRLVEARREKAAVADVEDRIPRLQVQVDESQKAQRLAEAVEALERRNLSETRLTQLAAEVDGIALKLPGIGLQKADASAIGKTLLENLKRALARFAEADRKLRNVRADGKRAGSVLEMSARAALDSLATELAQLGSEIAGADRRHREEISKASAARNQALRLLPNEEDDAFPSPSAEDFETLIAAASQADASRLARLQSAAFQSMLEDWRRGRSEPDPEIERKLQRLIAWLSSETTPTADRRPLMIAAVLIAFAVGGAFLDSLPLRLVVAAIAACLAAVVYFRGPSTDLARPEIGDLVGSHPDPAKVAALLESLSQQRALGDIEKQLDSKASIAPPSFDWSPISGELRLKCQNPYALAPLSTSLSAYHQAAIGVAESNERLAFLREAESEKREKLHDIFASYGFPAQAGQELDAVDAFKAWFECDQDLERAEADALAAEGALKAFLTENGIARISDPEEALAELNRRSPVAQKFQAAVREIENLESLIARESPDGDLLRNALDGREQEAMVASELAAIRRRLEAVATELPARQQELSDARSKVQAAERAAIPEREYAYEAALSKVEVKFEQLVRQAVRARIGKEIQERLRTTELPDVVRRASGHLESFTEGRFRLEIGTDRSEGLGMLVVRDKNREIQDFSQLSTGTKVHAVIAIRLAIIRSQEDKAEQRTGAITRFPLVADEALAVSDPECSQEIAQTLARIAEERQVIVFTNHPQDVALFRRYDKKLNEINLGEAPVEVPVVPARRPRKPDVTPLFEVPEVQLGLDI